MKLLLPYLKGYWKLIILALLLAAINQTFSLLDPYVFRLIVDDYASKINDYTKEEFIKGVSVLLLCSMGAAMVSRVAKNFQDYFVNVITQKLGADIYSKGLKHSFQLPYTEFEDQRSGETLGKLQKVRTDVERLINAVVNILFTSLVGIIFVAVYAIKIHWLIAPVYFLAVPLLGFMSSFLSKKIKVVQKNIVSETTALAGSTTESLRNIELVKSLGLAHQEISRLHLITLKILKLELKKVRYIRSISFVQGTFVNLLRSVILFFLLFLIFKNTLTLGQLFSLQIYSFFIFGPLQELGNIINIFRETEVSLQNFTQILNTPIEATPANAVQIESVNSLTFNNVIYKHKNSKSNALSGVSFTANLGETVAFVGPSGSGKTTLVKLLVGLYRTEQGNILINNIDTNSIDYNFFRHKLGFVTQETHLFSGSIKENLLFVKPNASNEELYDVLQKSSCENLLKRAENGLDTIIGEGGLKISGGEKQRLSIARALLRNPELLIFDEATSALDSITEVDITNTIKEISNNKKHLTIMVAHRLSTIMHAHKIIVLEKGMVAEQGSHDELLNLKGLYYAMWRQQIGEKREE
jgi:ATP-binding cassette, subfamily B, bacterial